MGLENIKKKLEQRCIQLKSANIYNEEQYEECLKNVFRKDFYENTSNETNIAGSEVVQDENNEKSNEYWNNILSDELVSKHFNDVTLTEYRVLKDKRDGIDQALLEQHKDNEDNQYIKLRHYYNEVNKNRDVLDKIEDNVTKLDKIKSIEDIKLENSSYTILVSFVIIFIIIAIILIIVYFKF
jgi:hypothetical protein